MNISRLAGEYNVMLSGRMIMSGGKEITKMVSHMIRHTVETLLTKSFMIGMAIILPMQ